MEDDELTQDILEQFDLICTQHLLENGTANMIRDHQAPFNLNQRRDDNPKKNNHLNRTASLDLQMNSTVREDSDVTAKSSDTSAFFCFDENARLKKEVAELREQLYMKLGELSTIKESANRLNAAKSDVIVRLENSLNVEREEFQRQISELTTQLAFREADYRLISTELTRVKEQLTTAKPVVLPDNLADFSPASQLIVSATTPTKEKSVAPQCPASRHSPTNHLPVAVSPVPSGRRSYMADGTWKIPTKNVRQELSVSPSRNHLKRARLNRSSDEYQQIFQEDKVCVADAAIETESSSTDPRSRNFRKLPFRVLQASYVSEKLDHKPNSDCPSLLPVPENLALTLTRISLLHEAALQTHKTDLSISAQPKFRLPPQPDVSSDFFSHLRSVNEYLKGINILSDSLYFHSEPSTKTKALSGLEQICSALPHLLARIEEVFKIIPNLLKSHTGQVVLSSLCSSEFRGASDLPTDDKIDCDIDEGICYLGEDPFAGAPASQIVVPPTFEAVRKKPRLLRVPPISCVTSAQPFISQPHVINRNYDTSKRSSFIDHPILNVFVSCTEQLQSIFHTLHLYKLSVVGPPNKWLPYGVSIRSAEFITSIQSVALLMSKLINGLADVFIFHWKRIKRFASSPFDSAFFSYPTPTPPTLQSQMNPELCRYPPGELVHSVISSPWLPALSFRALNMTVSLGSLLSADILREADSDQCTIAGCFPTFIECIVLAHGCAHLLDQHTENRPDDPQSLQSLPVVVFLRLFRCMAWSPHWNLEHNRLSWWEDCLAVLPEDKSSGQIADCTEYLRNSFDLQPPCRLSMLIRWTRAAADKLISSIDHTATDSNVKLALVDLLDEFSGFIASLLERDDVLWPDSCMCKAEVYSTLVHISLVPLHCLLTTPTSSWSGDILEHLDDAGLHFRTRCILAFGQLTRALIGLRCMHGDISFQTYTDALPSYFFLISSLSNWIQQLKILSSNDARLSAMLFGHEATLRPEFVEELYDFESSVEKPST